VDHYIVELYISRADSADTRHRAELARSAALELTRDETAVRHLHSIHVPEDETCFLLVEANSSAAVCDVLRNAAVPFERVVGAIVDPCASPTHERSSHAAP
jgi:hypothetical protein